MNILDISIVLFVMMESMNVFILYFMPHSAIGNGIGVFDEWEKTKENQSTHLFAKYLVNWVAGVKLIFIVLLIVIAFLGSNELKIYAVLAMILSIATYFWRLHPIIKKLDEMGHITPKGYSKALFGMISGFMIMFSVALIIYFI